MPTTATWLDDAVFYEIYPQSFRDTNADGVGDLQGIISKLDYVAYLGCNAIWLNPCFVSPFRDAGYDVSDYCHVAPRYGTNEDLRRLFDEAHSRGLRVILDLVPGHTSSDHPWFLASMRATENEFTDRYVWTDNVWKDVRGMGVLKGISERNGSVATNFFSHQPALNYGYAHPDPAEPWQQPVDAPGPMATRQAMKDVMAFWLALGCDGFRCDMAHSLVKEDEGEQATIEVWQDLRAFLDEAYPEAILISEWGNPDHSLQGGFDMDFLLHFGPSHYNDLFRVERPFFAGEGDVSAFVCRYEESRAASGGKGLMCIPSGNHDMDRLAGHIPAELLEMCFAFLLSMPGAPFIYYGDEIGMDHVRGLHSVEGSYWRTGARTPMQWDSSLNAGFSSAPADELYIPLDPNPERPTVAAQLDDEDSLLHRVRRLIEIRRAHPALQSKGDVEFVYAEKDAYPLAYVRREVDAEGEVREGGEQVLVVLNPSARPAAFCLPEGIALGETIYEFGAPVSVSGRSVTVPARSAGFYRVE